MYDVLKLSKYIITKCAEDGYPISNLQLQKILYYIQKSFLEKGCRAFDDAIEAWQFGPVVPKVYYEFCGFGAMPITMRYRTENIRDEDSSLINEIVESKRALHPWDLVEETHKTGGAWEQTYQLGKGKHHVIPESLIKTVG